MTDYRGSNSGIFSRECSSVGCQKIWVLEMAEKDSIFVHENKLVR